MILDETNKIAYLKFPSDPNEVRQATADGYEIIDILFVPKELAKGQKAAVSQPTQAKTADMFKAKSKDDEKGSAS